MSSPFILSHTSTWCKILFYIYSSYINKLCSNYFIVYFNIVHTHVTYVNDTEFSLKQYYTIEGADVNTRRVIRGWNCRKINIAISNPCLNVCLFKLEIYNGSMALLPLETLSKMN